MGRYALSEISAQIEGEYGKVYFKTARIYAFDICHTLFFGVCGI